MPYNILSEQQNYQLNWIRKRRDEWINENGPCKICGSNEDLEIDHINPNDKEINISRIWSRKKEIRDKELSKCQVLCSDCHWRKTQKQRYNLIHGTITGYKNYFCRCVLCTKAQVEANKKYKERKD